MIENNIDEKYPEYLQKHAIKIDTVLANNGFSDLEPLKEVFKDVKIIALGEATHGTKEFFQFKHRLTEFLVEELGYRVFTIEAGYAPCLNINDFVLKGKGDPDKALASQGYWVWDTVEVKELMHWIRDYNLRCKRGEECAFYGFDIKPVKDGMKIVESFFQRVDKDWVPLIKEAFANMHQLDLYKDQANDKGTLSQLREILALLKLKQEQYLAVTSKAEYEEVCQQSRVIYQLVDSFGPTTDNSDRIIKRDLYMAHNFDYLVNQADKNTKFIIWAHNAHIDNNHSWGQKSNSFNMGAYLRQKYRNNYYSLGFTFTAGSFQSRGMDYQKNLPLELQEFTVGVPPADYIEHDLAKVGYDSFIIDLRSITKDHPLYNWANQEYKIRTIGAGYNELEGDAAHNMKIIPQINYDGLFHIQNTTRAIPNPTGMRKAGESGALI